MLRFLFVMLSYLGGDSTTETVCGAIAERIETLPEHLRRSLTWDQGKEMAAHLDFSVKTGVDDYFCDPHSPWPFTARSSSTGSPPSSTAGLDRRSPG